MKRNLLSMLAGAVVFVVPFTSIAAHSEPTLPNLMLPQVPGLELTQEQQDKLQQLHQNTQSKIENILTQQQREQLQATIQQGGNPRSAFQSLNLSADQQAQLREVMMSVKSQMETTLTPEQREQIEQNMGSHTRE